MTAWQDGRNRTESRLRSRGSCSRSGKVAPEPSSDHHPPRGRIVQRGQVARARGGRRIQRSHCHPSWRRRTVVLPTLHSVVVMSGVVGAWLLVKEAIVSSGSVGLVVVARSRAGCNQTARGWPLPVTFGSLVGLAAGDQPVPFAVARRAVVRTGAPVSAAARPGRRKRWPRPCP